MNDISGNIEAVFLKLGIINVYHKSKAGGVLIKTEILSFVLK